MSLGAGFSFHIEPCQHLLLHLFYGLAMMIWNPFDFLHWDNYRQSCGVERFVELVVYCCRDRLHANGWYSARNMHGLQNNQLAKNCLDIVYYYLYLHDRVCDDTCHKYLLNSKVLKFRYSACVDDMFPVSWTLSMDQFPDYWHCLSFRGLVGNQIHYWWCHVNQYHIWQPLWFLLGILPDSEPLVNGLVKMGWYLLGISLVVGCHLKQKLHIREYDRKYFPKNSISCS